MIRNSYVFVSASLWADMFSSFTSAVAAQLRRRERVNWRDSIDLIGFSTYIFAMSTSARVIPQSGTYEQVA